LASSPSKRLQEAGLSAGRPLGPQELQFPDTPLDLDQVEDQLIAPERGTLAHRHELRRLEVRVAQAGQSFMRLGERGQGVDRGDRLVANELEGRSDHDQVGVVGHETTRCPEVDDRPRHGRCIAQGMDVRHHIVSEPALVTLGGVEVDRLNLAAQRRDLLLGDRQPQGALGLGQSDPQPPPGRELHPRRPEPGHRSAGIAFDQRIIVELVFIHQLVLVGGSKRRVGQAFWPASGWPTRRSAPRPTDCIVGPGGPHPGESRLDRLYATGRSRCDPLS